MVQLECMSEDDFSMIVEWFGRESPDLLLQWNKGVGTATLRKLIDKAVQQFQLRQLSLRVFDFNLPAIKCYEKLRICARNGKGMPSFKRRMVERL